MRVLVVDTPQAAARAAADLIATTIHRVGPRVVLGVATGSTPLGVYADLERRIDAGEFSLADATAFALDEYVDLPRMHPESYYATIHRTVTDPLGIPYERVHVLDGVTPDHEGACAAFEAEIRAAGGVDVQLLGIGGNGHIAFNEPGSAIDSRSRVIELTEQTRRDNARFFDGDIDQVPTHAVTQGIGTINDARELVLIAFGDAKADAVAALVDGPFSADCPASVLQRHPNATVVVDAAAAVKLANPDQYRVAQ